MVGKATKRKKQKASSASAVRYHSHADDFSKEEVHVVTLAEDLLLSDPQGTSSLKNKLLRLPDLKTILPRPVRSTLRPCPFFRSRRMDKLGLFAVAPIFFEM